MLKSVISPRFTTSARNPHPSPGEFLNVSHAAGGAGFQASNCPLAETQGAPSMILIDLSREIETKMQVLPNHPQVIVSPFSTHEEVRVADGYSFTTATMAVVMGDHAGTHVDAPKHFNADPKAPSIDQMPLENFFTEAVCLDLSHKPLKSDISIEDLETAIAVAGVTIKRKDTVLLHMDFYRRTAGTAAFITDFPGLTKESATWLGQKGIGMFGVEAVSPGRTGRNNFEVHHVCRDLGFTHMEGLVNLDKVVGKGRFKFIGFPIKIKGGSGAPIRAVAWLDG
jgi:kynurenine formamidase